MKIPAGFLVEKEKKGKSSTTTKIQRSTGGNIEKEKLSQNQMRLKHWIKSAWETNVLNVRTNFKSL